MLILQGTRKRWEQVAAYLGSRTMDEVLQMVKEKKGAASKKFESQENFRSGHKKKATVGGEPTQSDSFTENENLQSSSSKWLKVQIYGNLLLKSETFKFSARTLLLLASDITWTFLFNFLCCYSVQSCT